LIAYQKKNWGTIAVLAVGLLACGGCGVKEAPVLQGSDRQTRVVMNVLSVFYGEYLDSHQGTPPKHSDDFRKYLESRVDDLKTYKVDSPDQLMTSPRDAKPFTIVCGQRLAPSDSPGTPWAAYEQTGVNGKRMAVTVRGGAHELSADEIAQKFPTN